jgi:hypothetical protein
MRNCIGKMTSHQNKGDLNEKYNRATKGKQHLFRCREAIRSLYRGRLITADNGNSANDTEVTIPKGH